MSARQTIAILQEGACTQRTSALRSGQLLHLPAKGDVVIVGDLHNHTRNFQRIQTYAALDRFPQRHVILQELIHGGPLGPQGQDTSLDLLLEALQWTQAFPGRVHWLLANHDLAQVQKQAVLKDGYDQTERFDRHVQMAFGSDAPAVAAAFEAFVNALPLAAITVSGLFVAHSLPAPRDLPDFDASVLRRELTAADYLRDGSVYKLIWGRRQTPETLRQLAKLWWTDVFICGHQPQNEGFAVVPPNLFLLDSSHNHGAFLHLDLSRPYTLDDLRAIVRPLAALA